MRNEATQGRQLAVRSQVSKGEKEDMLAAIVHDPVVCSMAMEQLPPSTFGNAEELHYELMLDALYELIRDCGYAPGKVPYPALVGAINDKLENGFFSVVPEYQAELLSLPGELPDEKTGLLYWIYREKPIAEVDTAYALDLMRRLLYDRRIIGTLREHLGRDDGTVPVGFAKILQDIAIDNQIISTAGQSHSYSFLPDDYAPTPIIRFPSGISWIDKHLGGHAQGDVNGLIGTFGGGKTTSGVLLAVRAAEYFRAQWLEHGGKKKAAYFFTYEEHPERDVRPRIMCCAGRIWKETVEEMKSLDELSRTGNLRKYEREMYDREGVDDPAQRLGEYERLMAAKEQLQDHLIIEDMRAQGVGGGGVPEVVARLQMSSRKYNNEPGLAIVDYVNAMGRRHLKAIGEDIDKKMRSEILGMPEDFKQQVAEPFAVPVWLLQQYNAEANKKSASSKMHMVDSAECRTFGENLAFCLGFGTKDPITKVCQVHFVKARRRDIQGTHSFVKLVGELGQIIDVANDYVVEGDKIVEKKIANAIHGIAPAHSAGALGYSNAPVAPLSEENFEADWLQHHGG